MWRRRASPENMWQDSDPIQRLLSGIILTAMGLTAVLQAGRVLAGPDRGLQAEYFIGAQTSGAPAIVAVDPEISTTQIRRRWSGAAPTTFSARWFGFLTVVQAGRYTFAMTPTTARRCPSMVDRW